MATSSSSTSKKRFSLPKLVKTLSIFSTLLSLPLGTVIRLLDKDGMVGGFGKLYQSVKNLHDTYMQPNGNKDVLLKPKAPLALGSNILKLSNIELSARKAIYMCASGKITSEAYVHHLHFSSITLLNRFNVKGVGVLQEKAVDLGMQEGVKLVKASLQSKSVLTSVFIGKKAATSPA
uniref:uncharacterized protein LOC105353286 n=1 Tax=Fragaria vesca subsp. vesca TaxID=101020 RepID=UPI0005C86653|nr:PREDICTED: uncharacterized protein LOC105353286 [Fragaria vesca subsp. vesca]